MKKYTNIILSICFISVTIIACTNKNKSNNDLKIQNRYDQLLKDKLSLFKTLPLSVINEDNPSNNDKIKLGQYLYYDKALSKDQNISCNSCHNLSSFGVDLLPTSPGDKGIFGERNSPTVLNAALHIKQFWDGRANDVEEQSGGPILNPVEMNMDSEEMVINRIKKKELYIQMFHDAFPKDKNPITYQNLTNAIGVFERELITPSKFDDYLKGNKDALNIQEKKGLVSFINIGCTNCHSGATIGGDKFMKFGVYDDYWKYTNSKHIDLGREMVTGKEYDKYIFKVPSLRNINKTPPYFHDGSVDSLSKAIDIMAKVQLNYELSNNEKKNIVAFLSSLTGDILNKYKTNPFTE